MKISPFATWLLESNKAGSALDLEGLKASIERLAELGLIPRPQHSWQWLVHILGHLYPGLSVERDEEQRVVPTIKVKPKAPGDQPKLIFQKDIGASYLVYLVKDETEVPSGRWIDKVVIPTKSLGGRDSFSIALDAAKRFAPSITKILGVRAGQ